MSWIAAAIGAVGSLIGGNRQNKAAAAGAAQERQWSLEDSAEQFTRLRAAAEKGGFNPLAVLGVPGAGMPRATAANSADYMGKAIAESSLMLADSYAKTQAARQGRTVEDLRRQRDILTRKLTDATIRPTVPGVYQRAQGGGIRGDASAVQPGISRGGDAVTPQENHLYTQLHSSGSSTALPVPGTDIGEALLGWTIDQNNRSKTFRRFENSDEARAGQAARFRPAPMGWPSGNQRFRPRGTVQTTATDIQQNWWAAMPPVLWNWAR